MGVVREVKRGAFTSYLNTLLYCWGLFLFGWFAFFFSFYQKHVLFIHIIKINLLQKGDSGPSSLPTHT